MSDEFDKAEAIPEVQAAKRGRGRPRKDGSAVGSARIEPKKDPPKPKIKLNLAAMLPEEKLADVVTVPMMLANVVAVKATHRVLVYDANMVALYQTCAIAWLKSSGLEIDPAVATLITGIAALGSGIIASQPAEIAYEQVKHQLRPEERIPEPVPTKPKPNGAIVSDEKLPQEWGGQSVPEVTADVLVFPSASPEAASGAESGAGDTSNGGSPPPSPSP